jgi:hypothetical protein
MMEEGLVRDRAESGHDVMKTFKRLFYENLPIFIRPLR